MIRTRVALWTVLLVIGALLATGATAFAQDATPAAGAEDHPAHIHNGTCDSLGDVVYPLNNVQSYTVDRSFSINPVASPAAGAMASPSPIMSITSSTPVMFSFTHVADANIVDLIGGGYAVNTHESMANIGNYIACGNIPTCTGITCSAVTGVVVPLSELNSSGYVGVANIESNPNGGVDVTVFLFKKSDFAASS
jgi:hypothetical protein